MTEGVLWISITEWSTKVVKPKRGNSSIKAIRNETEILWELEMRKEKTKKE